MLPTGGCERALDGRPVGGRGGSSPVGSWEDTLHDAGNDVSSPCTDIAAGATVRGMLIDHFLTNGAYGFPHRGNRRRITPRVLAVVHVTGNGDNLGPDAAGNERDYANRPASEGPSAHYYVNRNGSGIHAIDETLFAAWSNGDLKSPMTQNVGIGYLVDLRNRGSNANEGCYLEIECVGTATPAAQWTDEQFATVAEIIADAAIKTSIAIDATTVLPHAFINTIDRPHCPSLHVAEHMSRLISEARAAKVRKAGARLQSFDVIPGARSGLVTVLEPGHFYQRPDGTMSSEIDPATFGSHIGFGPVRLTGPIGPFPAGELAYVIGTREAFIRVADSVMTPDSECSDGEIATAITADRAKARIVYT